MNAETKKAVHSGRNATANDTISKKQGYQNTPILSSDKRAMAIAKRRADIPKIHRAVYDNAVSGKSRKNAIKAFCLECVCWQKEEVRLCMSLACPLYPYRPYRISKDPENRRSLGPESTSSGLGV